MSLKKQNFILIANCIIFLAYCPCGVAIDEKKQAPSDTYPYIYDKIEEFYKYLLSCNYEKIKEYLIYQDKIIGYPLLVEPMNNVKTENFTKLIQKAKLPDGNTYKAVLKLTRFSSKEVKEKTEIERTIVRHDLFINLGDRVIVFPFDNLHLIHSVFDLTSEGKLPKLLLTDENGKYRGLPFPDTLFTGYSYTTLDELLLKIKKKEDETKQILEKMKQEALRKGD